MLDDINLEHILFLDVETTSQYKNYSDAPKHIQELWDEKADTLIKEENITPSDIYRRAAIYAEFGKIICVSLGYFIKDGETYRLRIKSISGHDEKLLLQNLADVINKFSLKYKNDICYLCAHNGKEFDFPYIARRLLINGIKLPKLLDIAGKKPWEVRHLDTMELWRFGDYKSYTSLKLLSTVFNIPSPKEDIDGSNVYDIYWHENNLNRIVEYCQKDVLTLCRLFMRYKGLSIIEDHQVEYV
jgi:uncharacterized protein YprB with RNaseH-like and TPR domain